MKLAINLPLLVFWQAFGEALALVRPLGLDAARLVDIFSDTSGAPPRSGTARPCSPPRSRARTPDPSRSTSTPCARTCAPWSRKRRPLGTELSGHARALECYDQASSAGLGKRDITGVRSGG